MYVYNILFLHIIQGFLVNQLLVELGHPFSPKYQNTGVTISDPCVFIVIMSAFSYFQFNSIFGSLFCMFSPKVVYHIQ